MQQPEKIFLRLHQPRWPPQGNQANGNQSCPDSSQTIHIYLTVLIDKYRFYLLLLLKLCKSYAKIISLKKKTMVIIITFGNRSRHRPVVPQLSHLVIMIRFYYFTLNIAWRTCGCHNESHTQNSCMRKHNQNICHRVFCVAWVYTRSPPRPNNPWLRYNYLFALLHHPLHLKRHSFQNPSFSLNYSA